MHRYFNVDRTDEAIIAQIVDAHLNGAALADFIKQELLEMLDEDQPKTLIIDFQNVKSVSSSMISSFLQISNRMRSSDARLVFCAMSESLRSIFKTLKLDGSVFLIVDSVEEALDSKQRSYFDASGKYSPPDDELA
ncbi:MAG: anti-sigma factor antagonist [Planctomycetales bacterium]|nr:anti-sigma factor antagonist [Planctomycetales bacterium]